jgi:hypothetical protein
MSTPPSARRGRRPAAAATPEAVDAQGSPARRESRYRARPPGPAGASTNPAANRVLRLTLTEPDTVPLTADQHTQAVKALSAMIVAWLQRQAHHGRSPAG